MAEAPPRAYGYPSPTSWGRRAARKLARAAPAVGYFLDSCSLCMKKLATHCDIFMYRGDIAFCSEECRQERIDVDEADERNRSRLVARNAARMEGRSEKEESAVPEVSVAATEMVVAG